MSSLDLRRQSRVKSALPALFMVGPVQLMVISMIFVPVLFVAWLSFNESSFGQAPVFVGLQNYVQVLSDPYFWRAMGNTILVVLIVVHVELLLGLGVALLFASGVPMRPLLLAAVLAPYAVSEISAVVMWRYLFDLDVGFATQLLTALG